MDDIFRGEEMTLCQIYFQAEAVYSCVAQLGELGIVQFRDLNPSINAFQRKFVNEVRRCEEMERKLRFLEKEIHKEKEIVINELQESCDAPKPKEMIELEATLEQLEHDLQEVNSNKDALKKNFLELKELSHILSKATTFFEEQERQSENFGGATAISMETNNFERSQALRLGFMTGVIQRDKVPPFELMLWRICRGNVFLRTAEIDEITEDPNTNDQTNKTVFIIFFQGEQLRTKVKKICDAFRATIYPIPETAADRREMALGVMTRLEELKTVLDQSLSLRKSLLKNSSVNLRTWSCRVRKMKAIYHTMNMFNIDNQKCLIAECWAPVNELSRIRLALEKGTELSGGNVPSILNRMNTKESPPTHHKTNKFTQGFQNIVDAYGIANYREINPAPFTVVTFPFLFAIMFGDAGHGLIMLLFALFMVLREKSLKNSNKDNEVWDIFFGGRYIILLMAAFSIYTGLIYNDVFSKSMNIFGSTWRVGVGEDFDFTKVSQFDLNPDPTTRNNTMFKGTPYPFGLDPVWQLSINKITFTNSLKMKFAIIIGIMQMFFGLILSLFNHLYFGHTTHLLFEFIPQLIFLTFIFVYLCIMIFIKWLKYSGTPSSTTGPACAPNLLIELIQMFFLSTSADVECKRLYPGQPELQKFLIIMSVLCIPVMLLVKPFILYFQNKKKSQYGSRLTDTGHVNPVIALDSDNEQSSTQSHTHNTPEEDEEHAGVKLEEDIRDYCGTATTTVTTLINEGNFATNDGRFNTNTNEGNNNTDEFYNLLDTCHYDTQFDMSEVFVEQCIHTIEYFLGCISHTASYLRLWALSLAHAQLSEVLWTMVLKMGFSVKAPYGFIMLAAVFSVWASFTVGVLLLMEGLSAFLHALRLHWVEFQSKFYKGEGYLFQPFSFTTILNEQEKIEN